MLSIGARLVVANENSGRVKKASESRRGRERGVSGRKDTPFPDPLIFSSLTDDRRTGPPTEGLEQATV